MFHSEHNVIFCSSLEGDKVYINSEFGANFCWFRKKGKVWFVFLSVYVTNHSRGLKCVYVYCLVLTFTSMLG